jgi:hypothetical protein
MPPFKLQDFEGACGVRRGQMDTALDVAEVDKLCTVLLRKLVFVASDPLQERALRWDDFTCHGSLLPSFGPRLGHPTARFGYADERT